MASLSRIAPSYLLHSKLAWISLAMIVGGFALKFFVQLPLISASADPGSNGPVWLVPVGYFIALAGSAILAIGWGRWKIQHKERPTA
jgi:uncharacterized membrane protein YidH (DUF202 family)